MRHRDAELEAALKAMEASFHVRLIATFGPDLAWAPAEALADAFLADSDPDFDQFPVRRGETTVGILLRDRDHGARSVREIMQPLSEGLLVSADMPITELIPQLRGTSYRLVVRGGRIDGLVTRSDLLKLPVRLVVFGLLTHFEQVMADLITAQWPADSWMKMLGEERRLKIDQKEEDLRRRGMNPPKIELTEFGDKRTLCGKLIPGSRSRFDADLNGLRDLRDQIMHASTFLDGSDGTTGISGFVDKFETLKRRIEESTALAAENRIPK